jgi:stage II sporulation protein AA (anti-sigma F factor antagonist)
VLEGSAVEVQIDKDVVTGILVVRLRGELDHHAVEPLRDEIEQSLENTHYRGLVLSFQGIDFMDSSGLGLILGRYRTLSARGGRMALCEVNSNLRKIFELSGIFKVVPVYASENIALKAIKEA